MTGGPFIGPRGGKWADAKHTIPWREMKPGSHVEPQGGAKVSPRLAAHRKQLRIGGEYKTSWGYVAVLPDPSAPGKVRTQSFDEQGFSGHQTYADLDALAADTVPHKGKWQPTPGILDKLSTTDQWAEGMARARTVQALNTLGYHRQRDDVERINRHVERHGFRSAADALSGWGEDDTELSPQTRARLAKASPRLVVKSQRARPTPPSGLTDGPLDYHLSWWGPRLIIKASVRLKRKVHPAQAGLFGDAPAARKQPMLFGRKPPGGGWQIIPGGKKGGYRRRRGKGWEYWYPSYGVRSKPHVADVGAAEEKPEPRLVVPVERPAVSEVSTERDNAVTQAMADKKTMGQRKKANETALDIVSKAAQAGRGLTDEEAIKVAQYTGKGGISGDLNQFYTPVKVAEAMWDVLAMYSDEPVERVLEPSCGSGVFLQTARKGAKVTGVELDSKAAAVSDALHGHTHTVESKAFEEFTIENLGGKPLDFDGVIANPPYCTRTGDIPLHKADFKSADKYFIDTSVDHLKDGGVATLLIHPGVLNNKSPGWQEFRERLLARCEIVDAFRLPNTTFKHVHCGIPADVLVLKKRDKRVGGALVQAQGRDELESVLKHFDAHDETFISGDYFESRPERVLGQALSKEETGWRATVEGDVEDVPAAMYKLADAQSKMVPTSGAAKPITYEALAELAQENEALKRNMQKAEGEISEDEIRPVIGATRDIARSRYVYLGDPPRWQRMDTVDDVTQIVEKTGDDAIKQAHTLSKEIADLIQMRQTGEYYKARTVRRTLAERVKTWVTEHGIPGSHKALGELSKSAPQLLDFLGAVDSNGELSDALSKDAAVTLAPAEVDKSDLMSVADFIARRSNGYVLPSDLQHNWEGWESESEDELRAKVLASGNYALDSTARANPGDPSPLQHIEDYLTGNLYTKLDAETARMKEVGPEEREHIRGQIAKLKERLETKQRSIDDIPIQLRVMGWMPSQWFSDFLNSDEGRRLVFYKEPRKPNEPVAKLSYENGLYELQWVAPPEGGVAYKRTSRWGPGEPVEVPAGTLISRSPDSHEFMKYLNRLALKKEQVEPVENEIEPAFNEWIKGSEHRDALEDLYNRTFNADFRREYSGDPLPIEGLREGIVPHHYQNQAVRWAAETGRGILGQDVGLGKTFIGILLAKIRKQEGKAKRPMVVVPKSVATNWAEEVETLIPGSRVLVIGEHRKQTPAAKKAAKRAGKKLGLTGDALDTYVDENSWVTRSDNDVQRNQKLAMVKQNEYDLIICTKPAFDRIPLRPETTKKYEEEDFWYQRAGELEAAEVGTAKQQTMDKKIAKRQAEYAQQELARKFKHREDMVYWEDMEIDTLMADEAHCFPAGTLVDSRPIESYKAGDVIRAFDHATGEVVKSEVVNVQLRAPDDLFRVRMEDGTALVCTGQHPLYTSSDGYVLAKDILEGDILYKNHPPAAGYCGPRSEERTQGERGAPIAIPDGPGPEGSGAFSTVRVAGVEAIEPTGDGTFGGLCPDGVVYNLEVKDHHTYMAEGVLVHNCYKNLYSARSRNSQKPKFLGGSGQSKQARKMQFMAKFVREKRPTNGVYFMTATPTKNSPLEVFNMLAHIAPEEFQRIGIENSEQFIDRFCRMEMQDVITAPGREKGEGGVSASDDDRDESKGVGNIESQLCVTGFKNLKELEGIMDKYMMIQTATDVGLKIPDRNNVLRVVDMTDEQEDIYDKLRAQAANVDPREDPGEMFRVFDRMKKAAQDLELYDPEKYSGWYVNSPKYTACVDAAYEGAMSRGGQLIFCDHNASHARLKAMLVEKGLKESEVGIINASVAKDSAARQAIGNRFNRNEIKVVIGNTGTMGEGVNLQGKKHAAGTTDIHHLDQPWDPGTFHQRNGRGVRQGNKAEQVQVHTYISKGSFDGFRDSSLRGKGRWLDKLRSGADSIANDMDGQSISDMEREAMVSQDPEQAMARIKEMAAKAKGAWYAKQAKGAVDEFHKWQKKHDRLRRMKRDSPSRQKLMADVERLKRQLLRSEVLPDPIKDHLESGDTSTVGVATFIDANDKWTARILRPGDVIRSDRLKHVVVAQDLSSGKLKLRQWGTSYESAIGPDALAESYKVTDYKESDELKDMLKRLTDPDGNGRWSDPIDKIAHISKDTLEGHRDTITEAVRQWAKTHEKPRTEVLVRTSKGIEPMLLSETEGKELVYPWGKDEKDLEAAIVAANPGQDRWQSYGNPLIRVGQSFYGMEYYKNTPFKDVTQRAQAAWEKKNKKAKAA